MRRVGEHLLALLIALHLVVIGITGIGEAPTPQSKSDRTTLKHLSGGDEAVVDRIVAVSTAWNSFRDGVATAARPYTRTVGTSQSWRMFAGTQRHSVRVEIAVRDRPGAPWVTVWREGTDPDRVLNQYRFRHYLRRVKRASTDRRWRAFAAWAGARTLATSPDAEAVRIRVMKASIPRPGAAARPSYDDEVKSTVVRR